MPPRKADKEIKGTGKLVYYNIELIKSKHAAKKTYNLGQEEIEIAEHPGSPQVVQDYWQEPHGYELINLEANLDQLGLLR